MMAAPYRLLLNSMPKSGTHLLTQVVDLLGYRDVGRTDGLRGKLADRCGLGAPVVLAHLRVQRNWQRRLAMLTAEGRAATLPLDVTTPVPTPVAVARGWLQAIAPGHYLSGHVPWTAETARLVREAGLKHLLIVRDPRDVLVSFLHFVVRPEHRLSRDFLPLQADERLHLALDGGVGPRSGQHIEGLAASFAAILAWRREPGVLLLRFEDLIGERGHGSIEAQRRAVQAICQALALDADAALVDRVCQQAFDVHAETFRRGKIGSWQDELTPDQLAVCEARFAPLLADLA